MRIGKFVISRSMYAELSIDRKRRWRCERFGPIWINWEEP